ncbi:MAG: PDZ domain-containing protein [Phycisphaerales bacterium]
MIVPISRAAEPRVEYIVHLDRPQTQTLQIEVVVHAVDADIVELVMPSWRPGRYVILDPAGSVRWFRAFDADGKALAWAKTSKNHWAIETAGHGEVHALYELYANSLGDRTRHVDETHAFLSGESVFMYDPTRREEPVLVRLEAPEGWQVATGLEPSGNDPRLLIAPDYDTLVDSPIEVGEHDLIEFEVDGVPHQIAVWGEGEWDAERMKEDFATIVREEAAVFGGGLPYSRYVFLLHVAPGIGGGTEHLNSTIMQTRPSSFESKKNYRGFLALVSHEFFHTWNVKRLRPAGITPYDYDKENYTKLLWVAEGTTSYYDDLVLARTGQIDVKEYLERIGGSIESLSRQPGRLVQSAEDSSFDAWVKFSHTSPDSGNTTVNFYQKGALVSLLLDLELRRRTDGKVTLDDVMRTMYERFPLKSGGYTPSDLMHTIDGLAGSDFGEFFAKYVSGTEELDFTDALAAVGLHRVFKADKDPWGDEDDKDEDQDEAGKGAGDAYRERATLGLSLTARGGGVFVRSTPDDAPAFDAGVIADDELLAINGHRVEGADIKPLLTDVSPGDEVTLMLSRRGQVFERTLVAGAEPDGKWVLEKVKDATPEQRAAFKAWMHQPFSPDDEADEDDATDDDPG